MATCCLVSEHQRFGMTYRLIVLHIIAILKTEAALSFEKFVSLLPDFNTGSLRRRPQYVSVSDDTFNSYPIILVTAGCYYSRANTLELHISGRWLSGSAWPFG